MRKGKEEPIFRFLNPKQCLVIGRTKMDVIVGCNEGGKFKMKRVPLPLKA